MGWIDRMIRSISWTPEDDAAHALQAKPTDPPGTVVMRSFGSPATSYQYQMRSTYGANYDRRRPSKLLRHFADSNEWIRVAIDRRKQQISQARWHIVRLDDPNRPPNVRVVNAVGKLFRYVNPKRESLRSLLDQVVEDLLVLDAGVIEKEKTLGGQIHALWAVDGATIAPDPFWDGSDPKAPRYRQFIDGIFRGDWLNDQMIYMMATPRTTSVIGWSKVETLVRIIEAELYGEAFDYDMLRQTAPQGILDLGPGLTPEQVIERREYWESDIAGTRNIAIMGGADAGEGPKWIQLQRNADELQRSEYKKWLATKIAAVFQMDLGVFNLTEQIHKSIGEKQQSLTDEGHRALATLVEEFITRELIWEFDENHAFRFSDLNLRDASTQAELDKTYIGVGALTPNEIRARDGLEKVPWGDEPYILTKGSGPLSVVSAPSDPDAPNSPEEPDEEGNDEPATEDDKKKPKGDD